LAGHLHHHAAKEPPIVRPPDRRLPRKLVWVIWLVTALLILYGVVYAVAVELGKAGH
jgi:hypothetical protein